MLLHLRPIRSLSRLYGLQRLAIHSYYDDILLAWHQLAVRPNNTISFGNIQYSSSSITARTVLTNFPNNWIIGDGGPV